MTAFLNRLHGPRFAIVCGVISGLVYGIYWIPLRFMDEAGFPGMWAVLMFNATAFMVAIPFVIRNLRQLFPGRLKLHVNTLLAGLSFVVYIAAFVYTEVIRVLVLFYLMPIWGFIFARIFNGDPITPIRWVSMGLGLLGLIVICGVDQGIPLPRNAGDWMALIAGVLWGGVSLSILRDENDPENYALLFLFWAAAFSLLFALIATSQGLLPSPDWQAVSTTLVWLIPLAILVIVPAAYATVYAPSHLNPGIVGLLFMTEISVGAGTAALFANEPFGIKEITGIILITLAGIAEPIRMFMGARTESGSEQAPR